MTWQNKTLFRPRAIQKTITKKSNLNPADPTYQSEKSVRTSGATSVPERCAKLNKLITNTFGGVIDTRGRHVHETRFTDEGIDRLSTIALLSQGGNDKLSTLLKRYYTYEFRKVRKIWYDRVSSNTKVTRAMLDAFFDSLFPIAFDDKTSKFRYPSGARI